MTATEELRRLLDKRGVEWMPTAWNPQRETFYRTANGVGICADEYTDGVRIHTDATVTPAQAVEATLGRGTCRLVRHGNLADHDYIACWSCSECSFGWHHSIYDKQFSYCPNCGRHCVPEESEKVVRCKDCRHAAPLEGDEQGRQICWLRSAGYIVEPDGFCSYGERGDA